MKSIDNSQVTENTEDVSRFCANLSSLWCSFPNFTRLAIEISRGDVSCGLFGQLCLKLLEVCDRFTVEWLQLWCNSILSHSSRQVQISGDYQFSQQSCRDFTRVPCGSDKYGLNNVLYTHPMMMDDLGFFKTFSQSKVERLVFLILQSSVCQSSQSYGMGCARATCSRNIARK